MASNFQRAVKHQTDTSKIFLLSSEKFSAKAIVLNHAESTGVFVTLPDFLYHQLEDIY